jgi:uncharacterized damage-inducible protein DinB
VPDAWLKGPVAGVPAALQPVAHALLNARIEFEAVLDAATEAELWERPAGIAAAGFHVRHACGSVDRLLTYARGESLSETQLETLADEKNAESRPDGAALTRLLHETLERAMGQLRATTADTLAEPRAVGRQRLPSTVGGLLFHAAEHAVRHAGQAVTTMKVLTGGR